MSDPVPFRPVAPGSQPPLDVPNYLGTHRRHPTRPLHKFAHTVTETTGPQFTEVRFPPTTDLTATGKAPALGERIIITGHVFDEDGRSIPRTMLEIWQANAAGRYDHERDRHDAPLDPNFHGIGRCFTDDDGRFRLITICPGSYPWPNGPNAWRARHIHFSLFGAGFASRLVTQMYFPGDPLLDIDPIYRGVPSRRARERLVARFAPEDCVAGWALGFVWDIVLRGRGATPVEN